MDKATFYRLYANTPIDKRMGELDSINQPGLTLQMIYQRLEELDKMDQPLDEERGELLDLAGRFLKE